jgi:hypothetical protein
MLRYASKPGEMRLWFDVNQSLAPAASGKRRPMDSQAMRTLAVGLMPFGIVPASPL